MTNVNNKEVSLCILTVTAGIANAYLWRGVIGAGSFEGAVFYSLPVVALFSFAILFALSSAFIRNRLTRSITAVLALASGYLLIPYSPAVPYAAGLTALGGWYAAESIANEEAASNSFSVRKIFRGGMPIFFTGVALVLSVMYLDGLVGKPFDTLIPRQLFDAIIPVVSGALEGQLPGFRSEATVDEYLRQRTAEQFGGIGRFLEFLPRVRNQLIRQERESLGRQLGLELTGQERLGDLLYQLVNVQINRLLAPYAQYVPFIAAAGFFVAVKTLTLPVYWFTLILVWGVVRLLVAANVLVEKTETVQVKRIEL